ncbi:MAG: hypothetical protein ACFB21_16625 [Opitutales bacterium]
MNSSLVLTAFLTASGAFTFWCSLKNYDWFFNFPGPSRLFILLVGRKFSRAVYLLFSIFLFGWGIARIVNPPPEIPTEFVFDLAEPAGIDLTEPKGAVFKRLKESDAISDLRFDQSGWISFWLALDPNTPYFADAVSSTKAGPDFHEGFAFRSRSYGDKMLDGRIVYFDADLVSCDNIIFSDNPLSSAHFALVICTPEASRQNGFGESLSVFYCRSGSELYANLIR